MSERYWLLLVGAWLLPLCAACGAQTQDGGGTDTSTDWVRECDEDAACDDEEHCACGICTRECDTDADCSALSPDAECAEAPSSCEEPGSICVADTSFGWLPREPEPDTAPEPNSTEPSPTQDSTCVAAIDKAACCLQVVAVTQSELDAEPCLVEAAGADPEQLWQETSACQTPDQCSGVDCVPVDARSWDFVAVSTDDGACELAPPCDDASCPGSPCDPKVGCSNDLACDANSCDAEGTCRVRPDVECGPAYAPVCGCDGVTYGNSCAVAGGAYEHDGECVVEEPAPPCDDGTCDASPCDPRVGCGERFGCDAPSCDEPGICRPLPDADCTDNYAPVCGCNGVTYTNSCVALGNSLDYEGECVVEEPTPPCDDGTCDGSPCDPRVGCSEGLGCEAPSCDEPGICTPVPDVGCDGNYDPVCGCNSVTYGNACEATGNSIDYEGECAAAE